MTDKIGHLLQHHPGGLTMLPDQFAWLQIQRGYLIYVLSILFSENVVVCVPLQSFVLYSTFHQDHIIFFRWEKFALGKIRAVTIGMDKPKPAAKPKPVSKPVDPAAVPKRRGRPPNSRPAAAAEGAGGDPVSGRKGRKRKEPAEEGPSMEGVGRPVLVVPPETVGPAVEPDPVQECEGTPKSEWPTRSTFAGRPKGQDQSAEIWDDRRNAFYSRVPQKYWKDALERDYWRLCVEHGDTTMGVDKFIEKMEPGKGAAKAKAKVPCPKIFINEYILFGFPIYRFSQLLCTHCLVLVKVIC